MADAENSSVPAATAGENGMPAADATFLITCLQNANGGAISIDASAVGEVLGFKNPRSVSNKISVLKKKYGLPFGTTKGPAGEGASRKASGAAGSPDAKVPVTPSKNRVAKRAPSAKKGSAAKNSKAAIDKKDEDAEEGNGQAGVENADESDKLVVKSPGVDDEAVFGRPETDDEEA